MGSGDTLRQDWDTIGVCWIGMRWIESVYFYWIGVGALDWETVD